MPWMSVRNICARESTDGLDVDVWRELAGHGRNLASRQRTTLPRRVYTGPNLYAAKSREFEKALTKEESGEDVVMAEG